MCILCRVTRSYCVKSAPKLFLSNASFRSKNLHPSLLILLTSFSYFSDGKPSRIGEREKAIPKRELIPTKKIKEVDFMKLKNFLFITPFFPVIIFKVAAQVGGPTFAQAQIATVIGLILAGIPDSFLPIQSGIPMVSERRRMRTREE